MRTDHQFVAEATREFEHALSRVVAEHKQAGRGALTLLGEPRAFAERVVRASVPDVSLWDDLVGPFVRSEGVQARLGITRQAVAAKAARRRLLRTITIEGDHLYPLWQFDDGHLVVGLVQVLALFPEGEVDGWTLAAWLRTPDLELGEIPLDVLRRGEIDRVLTVARTAAQALAG